MDHVNEGPEIKMRALDYKAGEFILTIVSE